MEICYSDTKKELPPDQLRRLFMEVGWSDGNETAEQRERFQIPFVNSTLVVSAWDGGKLVGVARVLSDRLIRSVIYDVAVVPAYQGRGIGQELLLRCMAHFPGTEWLVQTAGDVSGFYEKLGFKQNHGVFLSIPCEYFS